MGIEPTREFHFTEQDFQRICKLIHEHAGISLGESKRELVYSRLVMRLRATGTKTFAEYLDYLQRGDKAEWEAFVNFVDYQHDLIFSRGASFSAAGRASAQIGHGAADRVVVFGLFYR